MSMAQSVSRMSACEAPCFLLCDPSLLFALYRWANATLNNPCVVENTAYTAYLVDDEFINIVSRGNCVPGLYCDASQQICMSEKALGASCTADKE